MINRNLVVEYLLKNPTAGATKVANELKIPYCGYLRSIVKKWRINNGREQPKVTEPPSDFFRDTVEWIKKQNVVPTKRGKISERKAFKQPHVLVINIPDLHLGALVWGDETGGENYDTGTAEKIFYDAVVNLWEKASVYNVERILFVGGSDFFNVDNALNTTTAGTAQHEDSRWQKSFRRGVSLMIKSVEYLRGRTNGGIDLVIIPGNHDSARAWYMGEMMKAIYDRTEDVRVDNEPKPRKYYRYGTTLIGMTHGHTEKPSSLPIIMAGEQPVAWANTTCREFHTGHLHHRKESMYVAGNETGPVVVRIFPSLKPTDRWHFENGYVLSKRAAQAYLYSFGNGYEANFQWSPS